MTFINGIAGEPPQNQKRVNPPEIRKAHSKLELQMLNNPLGDTGTIEDAQQFRDTMDKHFKDNIPTNNPLHNSMDGSHNAQKKCLTLIKNGQVPNLNYTDIQYLLSNPPKHMHLSYFGTAEHSVDLVISQKESGTYVTVCNRGLRSHHEIFETYPLTKEENPLNEINNLLGRLNQIERTNGTINDFYSCFGERISEHTLIKSGFKAPPKTKDQKTGNCVRSSISAAQKWMAHQEGCMAAHKAVKPKILENIISCIQSSIPPSIQKVGTNELNSSNALAIVNETLNDCKKPLTKEVSLFVKQVPSLIIDFLFFATKNTLSNNFSKLTEILTRLEQLKDQQQEQLNAIREHVKELMER